MTKDFQPYLNLWRTTRTWFASHQDWLNKPWEKLNAEELDVTYENCQKSISGVFRYFKDRDLPKVFEIAEKMKK